MIVKEKKELFPEAKGWTPDLCLDFFFNVILFLTWCILFFVCGDTVKEHLWIFIVFQALLFAIVFSKITEIIKDKKQNIEKIRRSWTGEYSSFKIEDGDWHNSFVLGNRLYVRNEFLKKMNFKGKKYRRGVKYNKKELNEIEAIENDCSNDISVQRLMVILSPKMARSYINSKLNPFPYFISFLLEDKKLYSIEIISLGNYGIKKMWFFNFDYTLFNKEFVYGEDCFVEGTLFEALIDTAIQENNETVSNQAYKILELVADRFEMTEYHKKLLERIREMPQTKNSERVLTLLSSK